MELSPYLSFNGQCERAFAFYEQCLGGRCGTMFRYGGSPMADQVPPDWQDKVMHASITVGGLVLMGGDVVPLAYEEPKGFSLSLQMSSTADSFRAIGRSGAAGPATVVSMVCAPAPPATTTWICRNS